MNTHDFSGTGVALVTPFTSDGKIDDDALARMLWHCRDVDYFVVLGSTGESATITADERRHIVQQVTKLASESKIVLGVGGNHTDELVRSLKNTDFTGISAILSVVPSYNKPTQAGIIAHFKEVAANSPVPVILYNIPGRTGVNMTVETTLTLAKEPNIVGIKEASGNMMQVMQIIAQRPYGFAVISGDDALTLPMIAVGGDGVISVTANAYPELMCTMVRCALYNDFSQARRLHDALIPLFEAQMADGNPAGIKAALHQLGLIENVLRLPLTPVSDKVNERIAAILPQISSFHIL